MSDESDNVISMLDRIVPKSQLFEHGDRVRVVRAVGAFEELLLGHEFAFIRCHAASGLAELYNCVDAVVIIRPEALERCDDLSREVDPLEEQ